MLLTVQSLSIMNTGDLNPDGSVVAGSLRAAILAANAYPDPDGSVIRFDPMVFATAQTITLCPSGGPLVLSESAGPEVIQGTGAKLLTINGNSANRVLKVEGGATASLSGLTITNGAAPADDSDGGGIKNLGSLTVTDSFIEANGAIYGKGGGVDNVGRLTVINSTVHGNGTSSDNGGGIENTGVLTLVNSTLADNGTNGHYGGGVDNYGTLMAVNTTIAYNDGGGLLAEAGSTATLDNTIVVLNTFQDYNSLVAGRADILGPVGGGPAGSVTGHFDLVGFDLTGSLTDGTSGNQVGDADPGLAAAPADHGGPTPTIALLSGSRAIDRGSNALAVDPTTGSPLTSDQRGAGFPRAVNGIVDIGAFEQPIISGGPTYYTVNLKSDTGASSGTDAKTGDLSGDLRWAISQANANANLAGSVIRFDFAPAQTITLCPSLGQLYLSESAGPEVIQGPGPSLLTISGGNAVRVFRVDGATTATITGLTISQGSAPGDDGGGGIRNDGTLTVTDSSITNNNIADYGGGIANGGWLTVVNSTIANNGSNSTYGGGIWNFHVLTVVHSTISNNSSNGGGGIANNFLVTLQDTTVSGNQAPGGGGVDTDSGTLIATGSTIDHNSVWYSIGGGLSLESGSMTITNCTIVDNTAITGGEGSGSSPGRWR